MHWHRRWNSIGRIHERIAREHPELAERFRERRYILDEHLKERHPEVFVLIEKYREERKE